jgi:hypothetical protein
MINSKSIRRVTPGIIILAVFMPAYTSAAGLDGPAGKKNKKAAPPTSVGPPSQNPSPPATDSQLRLAAHKGIDLLMNGDPDAATEVFRQIQGMDSASPLGFLFEADATWWKIYLTNGNLVDPDVFDISQSAHSPYEAQFTQINDTAIAKADARIKANGDDARNYLYGGMGYALRARFLGLWDSDYATAKAGKKMRSLLMTAIQKDPSLEDAYLGLGIYNYFVDTLPGIVKLLRFLIALPGGDREVGLQQLHRAADHGDLVAAEAKFYLAKDYSRPSERQYEKSLQLFQEVAQRYPANPMWMLQVGTLQIRLGHKDEGQALYREALNRAAGMKSEVGQALHREAAKVLARVEQSGTPQGK